MGTKTKVYAIKQDELESLIDRAAVISSETAIKQYNLAANKARDKAHREITGNVRRILETYRTLKNDLLHSDYESNEAQEILRFECVSDLMQPAETRMDDLMGKEIERLKRNAWSKRQIDRAIDLFHEDCERQGSPEAMRKYRVIVALYIQDVSLRHEDIADQEHISERMVRYDIQEACKMIAPYLLDIDKILDYSQ